MAADLNLLVPEFREKAAQLIERCRRKGVEMRPNFTLRDCMEQARLWRQSRTSQEIQGKIGELKAKGADFLASCLDSAGPAHGAWATNAVPGLSWHQWGEAMDCFWVVDNRAEWSTDKLVNGVNGYRLYTEIASGLKLNAGGTWRKRDWVHVQLRAESSPDQLNSLEQINDTMRDRFGRKP